MSLAIALALITAVSLAPHPAPAAPAPVPASRFGWPLAAGSVVRRFDPPPRPWLAGHRGVDLAGAPAAEVRAVEVRAAGAGTVVYAGVLAGRGVISVAHPGGLRTTYEPVTPSVAVGAVVPAGSALGTLEAGHPGCPATACLHWGLRRGDTYLDPLILLGLGRVRLLPTARQ
ncbi:murein hydrolase activator EnvC family protein [Paractinoplanes rishiriensis]|nr:M23 family metallopeptidase [Actinoplanes rishiriensis]